MIRRPALGNKRAANRKSQIGRAFHWRRMTNWRCVRSLTADCERGACRAGAARRQLRKLETTSASGIMKPADGSRRPAGTRQSWRRYSQFGCRVARGQVPLSAAGKTTVMNCGVGVALQRTLAPPPHPQFDSMRIKKNSVTPRQTR